MALRLVTATADFQTALDEAHAAGATVGLVPTMGALHAGHAALVAAAAASPAPRLVAVTIFVNPLQFDDPADLERYPRTLDADLAVAEAAGADLVFAPPVTELYPDFPQRPATVVGVGPIGTILEGASRPGHFDGVATVVTKLFALAGRCRAYFGEKDFQQLAVVTRLARDLSFPVEVVGRPTVREPDGLALSSRNVRLAPDERVAAGALHRALAAGRAAVEHPESPETRPEAVEAVMDAVLCAEPLVTPDYAVAVDPRTLAVPDRITGTVRLLVAARMGPVRLIDNLAATVPAAPAAAPRPRRRTELARSTATR